MGFIRTCFILVILAIVAQIVIHLLFFLEPWAVVHNHAPGPCHIIEGINHGSEDMQTLPNGLTFITSGLQMATKYPGVQGKVFLFDLNKSDSRPVDLQIVESDSFKLDEFAPHGIYLREDQLGALHVYIVNHPTSGGHTVEKFEYDLQSKTLIHIKTIEDKTFGFINDLVVIGDNQFYVTNSFYASSLLAMAFELLVGLRWGHVIYYDGTQGRVMDDRLMGPNGIAFSLDKKQVYVSVFGEKQVRVYQRKVDNSLALMQAIDVFTKPDNLNVCPKTGDIWIGSHPTPRMLVKHESDPSQPSASQVLRLSLSPSGEMASLTEVYADSGHRLFGSSVAIKYKDGMLVGSIYHKLMYCNGSHGATKSLATSWGESPAGCKPGDKVLIM